MFRPGRKTQYSSGFSESLAMMNIDDPFTVAYLNSNRLQWMAMMGQHIPDAV